MKNLVSALKKVEFSLRNDNFNQLGKKQKRFVNDSLLSLTPDDFDQYFTEKQLREMIDYDLYPKLTIWDDKLRRERFITDHGFVNQQFTSIAIESVLFWKMHKIHTQKTRSLPIFYLDTKFNSGIFDGINILDL